MTKWSRGDFFGFGLMTGLLVALAIVLLGQSSRNGDLKDRQCGLEARAANLQTPADTLEFLGEHEECWRIVE